MKTVSVHTYFGSFALGVQQAEWDVVSDYETWKPGGLGAAAMGLPAHTNKSLAGSQKARVVIGNPPCNRFSQAVASRYNKMAGIRSDLSMFPELLDVLDVAIANDSDLAWWETGPMAWTQGAELIDSAAAKLSAEWKKPVTTLVTRLDLRYLGVPQRRPRCHIMHFKGEVALPKVPASRWPRAKRIGEYLAIETTGWKLENPVYPTKTVGATWSSPVAWAKDFIPRAKYIAGLPKLMSFHDHWSTTILGSTTFIWEDQDKWWDLAEYGVMMGFPIGKLLDFGASRTVNTRTLISKGVCSHAGRAMAEWIASPVLEPSDQVLLPIDTGDMVAPTMVKPGLWHLDLDVPYNAQKRRAIS